MSINNRVISNIKSGVVNVATKGFGTTLIVLQTLLFGDRYKKLSGSSAVILQAMLDLGFTTKDPGYVAVRNALSGALPPSEIALGRRVAGTAQAGTITLVLDGVDSPHSVTATRTDGTPYQVAMSEPAGVVLVDFRNTFLAALQASDLDALFSFTVGAADGIINYSARMPGITFAIAVEASDSTAVTTAAVASAETMEEALNAIMAESTDFYGVAPLSPVKADILSAATWSAAQFRTGLGVSDDAALISAAADNVAEELQGLSRDFQVYCSKSWWEFPNVGLVANVMSQDPGVKRQVWNNFTMKGYSSSGLTVAERANVESTRAFFADVAGGITLTGEDCKAASGEWMHVVVAKHWAKARTEELAFARLSAGVMNDGGVPFTNKGRAVFVGVVRCVCAGSARWSVHIRA